MNIFKRLIGRAQQALNTARTHPDKAVQDNNHLRAQTYMTAVDDVKNDEELRAGMHLAWMVALLWEERAMVTSSADEYASIQRAVDDLKKHSPILTKKLNERRNQSPVRLAPVRDLRKTSS